MFDVAKGSFHAALRLADEVGVVRTDSALGPLSRRVDQGNPPLGRGDPATRRDAEDLIDDAADIVAGLDPSGVTNKGNRRAMLNHLNQAIRHLQAGENLEARNKLSRALVRTDGVPLRGAPDGNGRGRDWILDAAAQTQIFNLLTQALGLI